METSGGMDAAWRVPLYPVDQCRARATLDLDRLAFSRLLDSASLADEERLESAAYRLRDRIGVPSDAKGIEHKSGVVARVKAVCLTDVLSLGLAVAA